MSEVKFVDHTEQVKSLLEGLAIEALEEAAGELESAVASNTAVDTGQLKGSWDHYVNGSDGKYIADVGSPLENAIWEELGTGEYALKGNGRKGGWAYEDDEGDWHFTHGKKPRRAFHKAYTTMKPKIIKFLQNKLNTGLK